MQIYEDQIKDASAWTRADIETNDSWRYSLIASEVSDLETALGNLRDKDRPLLEITRDMFPLPVLGPR